MQGWLWNRVCYMAGPYRIIDPTREQVAAYYRQNVSGCRQTMTLDVVKIVDTGKGAKSVAEDLEAVLRKIEHWHQGSIAAYRISFQDAQGAGHTVQWDGQEARISN
jgi:hypothetical protein